MSLKSCPKSNKLPNLVTLDVMMTMIRSFFSLDDDCVTDQSMMMAATHQTKSKGIGNVLR